MITVVGETVLDLVADADGRSFTAYPGGSPANVAVGLARLGATVTLATQLGDDLPGRIIASHLRDNGVDVEVLPSRSATTSLALASIDDHGIASYDFRITWDVTRPPDLASECRCLHTGSIASSLPPGAAVVDDLLNREHQRKVVTISLDPNVRPSLLKSPDETRSRVERHVAMSDVVKVSADDLHWLYPDQAVKQVAVRWLERGPALIVVTLGPGGAYGLSRTAEVTRPAIPVNVMDTVGAGDAFGAALLEGLRQADLLGGENRDRLADVDPTTLTRLLDFAIWVASITCGRPGADPPTRAELDQE